jgi:hypothetical protein
MKEGSSKSQAPSSREAPNPKLQTAEGEKDVRIYTRCPACKNDTLRINKGHLLCTWHACPNPTLIEKLVNFADDFATVTIEALAFRKALDESVALQSHYAKLLNQHDGGERIGFKDAEAWIARLRETGKLPKTDYGPSVLPPRANIDQEHDHEQEQEIAER